MKKRLTICLIAASILTGLTAQEAQAQRTVNSSLMLTAEYSYPFGMNGEDFCVDLECGQYLLDSYWNSGITGALYSSLLKNEDTMQYAQILGFGEWMYRLAATRSRCVNLYLGGGVFLGYEAYDPFGKLPSYYETDLGEGSFIYGMHAHLESEFYFCRNIAFVLGGRLPVNFSSPVCKVHYHVNAGIRINLK